MADKVLYMDDDLVIEVDEDLEMHSVWFFDRGLHMLFVKEEWDNFCNAMQLVIGED